MLPPRAYAEPLPPFSPGTRLEATATESRPALVVVVATTDVEHFPSAPFSRFAARNTSDAIRLIERWRPRVVALDWDVQDFDGKTICATTRQFPATGILAMMTPPERAPSALKAGCHALLLKPFAPNLLAARIGRLARELPTSPMASRLAEKLGQFGTNRTWPEMPCPKCAIIGAVSFEHSSHRRSWYACLSCESVWLGRRQE